jgi:hypothetical protein
MAEVFQHDSNDPWVYNELQSIIERDDLILFAGAGLSAQARTADGQHPPLWRELMEKMVAWCQRENLISDEHGHQILELVNEGWLLDAGQEIEEAFKDTSPAALKRCLTEVLLYDSAETTRAHWLATKVRFRAFLTTNYDDFIEDAYVRTQRRALMKFYEDTHEGVLDAWRNRQTFILKIHGDVSHPQSIVLGSRSYERVLYENEKYSRSLETLIGGSSLLFIGFGGTDPNLEHILSRASMFDGRSKRHWMLAASTDMPALKAKRLWSDKGINVIFYRGGHDSVGRFLDKLVKQDPARLARASRTPRISPTAVGR